MSIYDLETATGKPLTSATSSRRTSSSASSGLSALSTNKLVHPDDVAKKLDRNVGTAQSLTSTYDQYLSAQAYRQAEEIEAQGGWMKYPMSALGAIGRAGEWADRFGQWVRMGIITSANGEMMDSHDQMLIFSGRDEELSEKWADSGLAGDDPSQPFSGSQAMRLAGWEKTDSGVNSFARFIGALAFETVTDPLSAIEGGGGGRGVVAITKSVDTSFTKGALKVMDALHLADPGVGKKASSAVVDLVDADMLETKMVNDILAKMDEIDFDTLMPDATWQQKVDAAAGVSRTISPRGLDNASELLDIPTSRPDMQDVLHLGAKAKDDPVAYGVLNQMKDDLAEISGRRNWHSKDSVWKAYLDRVAKGRGDDWTTGGLRFGVPFTDLTMPIPGVTAVTRGAVSRARSGVGKLTPFAAVQRSNRWSKIREDLVPKLGAERYERIAASRGWAGNYATYSQFTGAQEAMDIGMRMFPIGGRQVDILHAGDAAQTLLIKSLRKAGQSKKQAKEQTADIMQAAYQTIADHRKNVDWDLFPDTDFASRRAVQALVERGNDAIARAGDAIVAIDPSMKKYVRNGKAYFPVSFTQEFSESAADLLDFYRHLNLDELWIKTPIGNRKVDLWEQLAGSLNRASGRTDITTEDAMLLASVMPQFGNKTANMESLGISAPFRRRTLGVSGMFISDASSTEFNMTLRSSFPQNSTMSESLSKTLSALADMRKADPDFRLNPPKGVAKLSAGEKTALQVEPSVAINDYLMQVQQTIAQQIQIGEMVRTGRASVTPHKLDLDAVFAYLSADDSGLFDAAMEVVHKAMRLIDNDSEAAAQLMAKKPLIIAGRDFGEIPNAVLNDPVVVKAIDNVEKLLLVADKSKVIDPHAGQRQIDKLVREGVPEHVAIQQVVATQLTGLAAARAQLTDAYRSAMVRRYSFTMEHVMMVPDEQSVRIFDTMQQAMDFEAAELEETIEQLTTQWAEDMLGEATAAKIDLMDPTTWVELDQYAESASGKLLKSQQDWYDERISQIEDVFDSREPGHPTDLDLKIELAGLKGVRAELDIIAAGEPGKPMRVYQVISGGQGGVDQAGLRGARNAGTSTGGTLPAGGRTNRGAQPELADEFDMTISDEASYIERTKENVDNSDVTVAFLPGWGSKMTSDWRTSGGTQKTIEYAMKGVWGEGFSKTDLHRISHLGDGVYVIPAAEGHKPVVIFTHQPKSQAAQERQIGRAQQWINQETQGQDIVMNVAGPRDIKPMQATGFGDDLERVFPNFEITMDRQSKVGKNGKLLPSGVSRPVTDSDGRPYQDILATIDPETGDIRLKNPYGMTLRQVQEQARWTKAQILATRHPDFYFDNAPDLTAKPLVDMAKEGQAQLPDAPRKTRTSSTATMKFEETKDIDVRDLMDVNENVLVYKDFLLGKGDDGKLRFTIKRFERELKALGVDIHGVQVRFEGNPKGKRDEYARLLMDHFYDTPGSEAFDGFTPNGAVYQRRTREEPRGIMNGMRPFDYGDPQQAARPSQGFVNLSARQRRPSTGEGMFGTPLERRTVVTKKYREELVELAEDHLWSDGFIPRDADGMPTGRWKTYKDQPAKWLDDEGNLDLELVPIEIVYDELHRFMAQRGQLNLMPGQRAGLGVETDVLPLEAAGPMAYQWEQELLSLAKKSGLSVTSIRADIRRVRAAQAAGESPDEFLNDIAEKLQRKGVDASSVLSENDRHMTWEDALEQSVPDGRVTPKVMDLSEQVESVLESFRMQNVEINTQADVELFLDEIDPKYVEAYRDITTRKEAKADPFARPDEPTSAGSPVEAKGRRDDEAYREWKDDVVIDIVEAVVDGDGGTNEELVVVLEAWQKRHTKSYEDPQMTAGEFKERGTGAGTDDLDVQGYEESAGDSSRRFAASRRDEIKGDVELEQRNAMADTYMEFDETTGQHAQKSWSGEDTSDRTPVQRRVGEEPLMGGNIPHGDTAYARQVVYEDVYFAAGHDIVIPQRMSQIEWRSPDFVSSKEYKSAADIAEDPVSEGFASNVPGTANADAELELNAVPDETLMHEGDVVRSTQAQEMIPEDEMTTGTGIQDVITEAEDVPAVGERVSFNMDSWVEKTVEDMLTQETTRSSRMHTHMAAAYTDKEMAAYSRSFAAATSGDGYQIAQIHRINTAQARSAWETFRTTGDPAHLHDPDLLKTLALGEHLNDPNAEATVERLLKRTAAREKLQEETAADLAEKTGKSIDEAITHIQKSSDGTLPKKGDPFQVSTKAKGKDADFGDERFSAFNARITGRGNKSIEYIYQVDYKGYKSIAEAKKAGTGPIKGGSGHGDTPEESLAFYHSLWEEFADENPDMMMELYDKTLAIGRPLLDDYGKPGRARQDESLTRILKSRFADLEDEVLDSPMPPKRDRNVIPGESIPEPTPEKVTSLEPGQVFVFGSNEQGVHGKGAAKQAVQWGAEAGQGSGRQGNTYALPTKATPGQSLPSAAVKRNLRTFFEYAGSNTEDEFLMTRVGTGLAGFSNEEISDLLRELYEDGLMVPPNVRLPRGWDPRQPTATLDGTAEQLVPNAPDSMSPMDYVGSDPLPDQGGDAVMDMVGGQAAPTGEVTELDALAALESTLPPGMGFELKAALHGAEGQPLTYQQVPKGMDELYGMVKDKVEEMRKATPATAAPSPQAAQVAPQGAPPEVANLVGGPAQVGTGATLPTEQVGAIYDRIIPQLDADILKYKKQVQRLSAKQKSEGLGLEALGKAQARLEDAQWAKAEIDFELGMGPPQDRESVGGLRVIEDLYNREGKILGFGVEGEVAPPPNSRWAGDVDRYKKIRESTQEIKAKEQKAHIDEITRQKAARESGQAALEAEELSFTSATTLARGQKTKPLGATYVGRGSDYGNPYIVRGKDTGKFRGKSHPIFKNADGTPVKFQVVDTNAEAVGRYMEDLWAWAQLHPENMKKFIADIHGKQLWYKSIPSPPDYSHGDVLADAADMLSEGLDKPKNNKYLAHMYAVDDGVTPEWLNARVEVISQQLKAVQQNYTTHQSSRDATLREAEAVATKTVKDMTERLKQIQQDIDAAVTKPGHGIKGPTPGGVNNPVRLTALHDELNLLRPRLQEWVDQAYGPGRLVEVYPHDMGIDVSVRMAGDEFAAIQRQTEGSLTEYVRRTGLDPGDADFIDDAAVGTDGMRQMVNQYNRIKEQLDNRAQRGISEDVPERAMTPEEKLIEERVASFETMMDLVWDSIENRDSTALRNFIELKGKKGTRASKEWQQIMDGIDDPMQRALVQHWVESAWAADLPWDSDTMYHGWWQAQRQTVQAMDKGVDTALTLLRHQMDAAAEILGESMPNPRRALRLFEAFFQDLNSLSKRGTGEFLVDDTLRPSMIPPLRDLPGGLEDMYRPRKGVAPPHGDVMRAGKRASGGEELAAIERYLHNMLHDDPSLRRFINEGALTSDDVTTLRNFQQAMSDASKQPNTRQEVPGGQGLSPASEFGLDTGLYVNMFVDKLMGRQLEQQLSSMEALYTPLGMRMLNQTAKGILDWWKRAATISRPTFHIRNLIGGMWNNAILGVNPKTYFTLLPDVYKFRKLMKRKTMSSYVDDVEAMEREVFAHLSDKNRAMFREAWHQDILQSGFARSGLQSEGRANIKPWSSDFFMFKAGGQTMESFEDLLRISAFNKFFDPEYPTLTGRMGREMVNTVHFDYANLTTFERKIKAFIPFFVWTRRNIPLQLRMLMEKPSNMILYERARKAWNTEHIKEDDEFGQYKKNAGWVMPWSRQSEDGEWSQGSWNPALPFNDLFNTPLFTGSTSNAGVMPLGSNATDIGSWAAFAMGMVGPGFSIPLRGAEQADDLGSVVAPTGLNEVIKLMAMIPGIEPSTIPFVSHQSYDGDMMVSKVGSQMFRSAIPFYTEYRALLGLRPNSPYSATDEGYLTEDMDGPVWDYRNAPNAIKNRLMSGLGFTYMSPEEAYWYGKEAERFLSNEQIKIRQQLPHNR